MKLIAYIRVSTEQQELSPEAQERELRLWASATGNHIVRVEPDIGVSGGLPPDKRPALMRAIEAIGTDAEGLLVLKRDRLARSVIHACAVEALVERAGGRIYCAHGSNAEDPESRLMRQIVDAFAEYERACIRLRTSAAMATKKRRGEYTGNCPYGQRVAEDGVHLEPDPFEQDILQRIRAARERGLSIRAIARSLTEQGVPPRGKAWRIDLIHHLTADITPAARTKGDRP